MQILTFMSENNILTGAIILAFLAFFGMCMNLINDWFDKSLKLKYDLDKSIRTDIKSDLDMIFNNLDLELKKDEKAKLSDTNYDC